MAGIFEWVLDILFSVFASLFILIGDAFLWLLKQLLDLILLIVGPIGAVPGADIVTGAISQLPPEMWELALRFNLPALTGVFVAAVIIRIILQLIPLVRLGS